MVNPVFLMPVDGDEPCGPELRWDPAFLQLSQAMDAAVQAGELVVDAELASSDGPTFEEIVDMARALSARTKDVRILTVYAEASWRDHGLAAFAGAMEDITSVIEAWPGHNDGIYPRADEEDGDLGERAAPLGKLLNLVPNLVSTIGWGQRLEISERIEVGATLRSIFDAWNNRLEPAFGRELPSRGAAWTALLTLLGDTPESQQAATDEQTAEATGVALPTADAWDTVERAAELMAQQDRHSPALPMLRLLASWRLLGIMEIAEEMRTSGVSLEQLLESIKRQTEQKL